MFGLVKCAQLIMIIVHWSAAMGHSAGSSSQLIGVSMAAETGGSISNNRWAGSYIHAHPYKMSLRIAHFAFVLFLFAAPYVRAGWVWQNPLP